MKRHTKQSAKQSAGQYFTSNAAYILSGLEHTVKNKQIIDPFAGNNDLTKWAIDNGAISYKSYDIAPLSSETIYNDSLLSPPDYTDMVVTNPPYLSKNKSKTHKEIFDKWNESDLYKCHIKSLVESNNQESIQILPSNFLCESRAKTRELLFFHYAIVYAKYWCVPVFDDATTGVVVLHLKRKTHPNHNTQSFEMMYNDNLISIQLEHKYGYLYGKEFFEALAIGSNFDIIKTDIGMAAPNTNIIVGLLDKGKYSGLHYNDSLPIYCKKTSFTTYQITLSINIDIELQQDMVVLFNELLTKYRKQYYGMFLANYMGPKQKILSRNYVHGLIKHCHHLLTT